ncbi:MAG TPA: mandelate racemase/muconate lactonizing enzyme family protein [Baekduia sp.]|uniref:mandelate racemase/muconate lactonizing enzyme family protein n=1 Tax=Baekduia sp. TaxID=2600305 RepID=UPI002D79E253|nr:mandelate racemase/muconate lactonizing enzyme family protein [Baekduia sp.]HET6505975.1 mandelate racemase/muconate lactonizing enzyme family protein [Baekduia sp.]
MDVALHPVTHRFRTPLRTSYGEVRERSAYELTITTADGISGRGEAAPLEAYDGVPFEVVGAALARYAEVLSDDRGRTGPQLLDACREVADLPQALAAVDLALWDAAARRAGRPVAALLTDTALDAVPVNATLGATDRATAAEAAARAAEAGFACVKVKVGVGDDVGRVAAVRRAVGDEVSVRLDANGAWSVDEAVDAIEALAADGPLELVEEPVSGIGALREVRERVPVRIAMDETASEHGAIASAAADAVCLKVSRAGGISALLAQAALVRATGAEAYVASTLDGPIGIAAALHCAAALRVELPCGLATLELFESGGDGGGGADASGLVVRNGRIAVPSAPGLL